MVVVMTTRLHYISETEAEKDYNYCFKCGCLMLTNNFTSDEYEWRDADNNCLKITKQPVQRLNLKVPEKVKQ